MTQTSPVPPQDCEGYPPLTSFGVAELVSALHTISTGAREANRGVQCAACRGRGFIPAPPNTVLDPDEDMTAAKEEPASGGAMTTAANTEVDNSASTPAVNVNVDTTAISKAATTPPNAASSVEVPASPLPLPVGDVLPLTASSIEAHSSPLLPVSDIPASSIQTPASPAPLPLGDTLPLIAQKPGRWYCISRGRQVGVFYGWQATAPNVIGVGGACYVRYSSYTLAAEAFNAALESGNVATII